MVVNIDGKVTINTKSFATRAKICKMNLVFAWGLGGARLSNLQGNKAG